MSSTKKLKLPIQQLLRDGYKICDPYEVLRCEEIEEQANQDLIQKLIEQAKAKYGPRIVQIGKPYYYNLRDVCIDVTLEDQKQTWFGLKTKTVNSTFSVNDRRYFCKVEYVRLDHYHEMIPDRAIETAKYVVNIGLSKTLLYIAYAHTFYYCLKDPLLLLKIKQTNDTKWLLLDQWD